MSMYIWVDYVRSQTIKKSDLCELLIQEGKMVSLVLRILAVWVSGSRACMAVCVIAGLMQGHVYAHSPVALSLQELSQYLRWVN